MRENKNSKRVAKAVIFIDGEILLLLNDDGWDLPGGHVEKGETMPSGLVREIEEETGIKVGLSKVVEPFYKYGHTEFYEINLAVEAIVLSDEHESYQLVPPDSLDTFTLSKRYRRAIKKTLNSSTAHPSKG